MTPITKTTVTKSKPAWQPDDDAIRAIVEGRHGDPFAVLGPHGGGATPLSIRVFWPGAETVTVLDHRTGEPAAKLTLLDKAGFFAGEIAGRNAPFPYRLRYGAGGAEWEAEDPYRFPRLLGDVDVYLMAEGSHRRIFDRLGAHPRTGRRGGRCRSSPSGRRTRGAFASSATSTSGTAAATRCASASRPASGSSSSLPSPRARATSSSCCRREAAHPR